MKLSPRLHFPPALRTTQTTTARRLPPPLVSAALLWMSLAALPAEPLKFDTLTTTDGKTYQKVEVVSQDAIGIKINHDGGIARLAFEKLPEELQKHFGYDPAKAAAQQTEEAQQERQHQQQMDRELLRKQQEQRKPPPPTGTPAVGSPESGPGAADDTPATTTDFDLEAPPDEAELSKLEAYIIGMKVKMDAAQQEITALQAKAAIEAAKMKTIRQIDSRGNQTFYTIPDKSAQFRAKSLTRKAGELTKKIDHARHLVGVAEAKYARLTGTPGTPAPPARKRP